MAGGIQEAKSSLRQKIKMRLANISVEDKLLQSTYVASKVSRILNQ